MGKAAQRRNSEARERLSLRFREGALIAFSAIFIFLLVALSTYSADDPGWSRTGTGGAVDNAVGPVGAWFADVFYALFGYMAYLFPAMLGFQAVRIFRDRASAQLIDPIVLSLRFVGFVLVMMASTALAGISAADAEIPFGAGGVLGEAIGAASVEAFSVFGARLVLVAILLFGLTIFTDLSWLAVMDKLGALTLGAVSYVLGSAERARRWYLERRSIREVQNQRREAVVKQIAKQKDRIPPKISAPAPKQQQTSQRVEKERQKSLFDAPVTGDLPPLQLLDEADHHAVRCLVEAAESAHGKLLFDDGEFAGRAAGGGVRAGGGDHDEEGEDVGRGVEEVVALADPDGLQRRAKRPRRPEKQRRIDASDRIPARKYDERDGHQTLSRRQALVPASRIVEG